MEKRVSKFALGRPDPTKQVERLQDSAMETINVSFTPRDLDEYSTTFRSLTEESIMGALEEAMGEKEPATTAAPKTSNTRDFKTSTDTYQGTEGLLGLVDKVEGGGKYNTLFAYAQDKDTPFKGVDVTAMTLDELYTFTDPKGPYGQWVKENNPDKVVSTPLGRYQIVGRTLKDIAKGMGLSGKEKFTPELQDQMFAYLAARRIRKADSDKDMLKQLRLEWDGFNKLDDAELLTAAKAFRFSKLPQSRPAGLGAKK